MVCFVSFSVLFVCICVLYYCHRMATQLQLNISYHHLWHPHIMFLDWHYSLGYWWLCKITTKKFLFYGFPSFSAWCKCSEVSFCVEFLQFKISLNLVFRFSIPQRKLERCFHNTGWHIDKMSGFTTYYHTKKTACRNESVLIHQRSSIVAQFVALFASKWYSVSCQTLF